MLSGRYEIIELVGSGGMSEVYKAKCHVLNRYVAIKVLKPEFSSDVNFVTKFRIEAQSAAGLSHPNIVNVYDVGEDNGIYYIVMELVEGTTLKEYIQAHGRIEPMQAIDFAIQIAQGLQAAHEHHTIHRQRITAISFTGILSRRILLFPKMERLRLLISESQEPHRQARPRQMRWAVFTTYHRSRQGADSQMREVIFIHSVSPCMRCSQDMFHLKARTMWL